MTINEKQKWPQDKRAYDRNYLRVFGKKCKHYQEYIIMLTLGQLLIELNQYPRHFDVALKTDDGMVKEIADVELSDDSVVLIVGEEKNDRT